MGQAPQASSTYDSAAAPPLMTASAPQPFVVVSYCTEGNGYREEAEARLLPSLRRFACPHHLYIRPSWGSWRDNLFHKPAVIAEALDDFPGQTIVWLDGDAELVDDPVLFRQPTADFACHFRTIAGGRKPAPNTIVLRNNDAARQLLALWIAECEDARQDPENSRGLPTHRSDGLVDDAALLQRVLTPPPPFVTLGELPLEYSSIFDNVLVERPVVLQHQASRRLRWGGGGSPMITPTALP